MESNVQAVSNLELSILACIRNVTQQGIRRTETLTDGVLIKAYRVTDSLVRVDLNFKDTA